MSNNLKSDWTEHSTSRYFRSLSYRLKPEANPEWWIVVFTYYDGLWMYKFGRRGNKSDTYFSVGQSHHSDVKALGYRTAEKAKAMAFKHIEIIEEKEKEALTPKSIDKDGYDYHCIV